MTINPALVATPEPVTTGCWSNFVDGASKTVNWCGRQISTAGTAIWGGIKKIAEWTAIFFQRAAYHISMGFSAVVTHVKANATAYTIGTVAIAAGVAIALLFNRICGCCNSKAGLDDAADTKQAVNEAVVQGKTSANPEVQSIIETEVVNKMAEAGEAAAENPPATTPAAAAPAPVAQTPVAIPARVVLSQG